MKAQISYEDNVFILNTRIRAVSDLMLLDADPDLFLEKTIDDLEFISEKLTLLLESLKINTQLISRDEHFHNLDETIERFSLLLGDMQRGSGCFCVRNYPSLKDTVQALQAHCVRQQQEINLIMKEMGINPVDPRFVSTDEMAELLKDI
jgi:hypothetical protein